MFVEIYFSVFFSRDVENLDLDLAPNIWDRIQNCVSHAVFLVLTLGEIKQRVNDAGKYTSTSFCKLLFRVLLFISINFRLQSFNSFLLFPVSASLSLYLFLHHYPSLSLFSFLFSISFSHTQSPVSGGISPHPPRSPIP